MTGTTPTAGQLQFVVLGQLSLTNGDETAVVPPSRPAILLAALLLHANTVVPVTYLQRAIWGDEPPEAAKAAVQTAVVRLRRLFGTYGIASSTIETLVDGYRISADADTLDLLRFRELLAGADRASEPVTERDLLTEALSLWGRPILGNVPSDLLQCNEVPRLTEEWLRARDRLFDIDLALSRCREILPDLVETTRLYPLHERFWEQLIEALYRSGRRAEALAEYRTAERRLRKELGIDPGERLKRLQVAILRGDALTGPAPATSHPSPATSAPPASASASELLGGLIQAGLVEENPRGHYRMNELLRLFARAAGRPPVTGAHRESPRPTGTRS